MAPDDHEDPFVTMLYYPPALYDEASATGVLQLPDYVNPETGSFNDGLKINGVWELIAREPDADTNNPFSKGIMTVVLPKYVESIDRSFWESDELSEVKWGPCVTKIADSFLCLPQMENLALPSTVESISGCSFKYLPIREIDLSSVKEFVRVGSHSCFTDLEELRKVSLSPDARRIDEYSFCYLSSLEEVVLPVNPDCVMSAKLFLGCPNLKRVYAPAVVPLSLKEKGVPFGEDNSPYPIQGIDKQVCVLYVPQGSVEAYRNDPAWGGFAKIEPYDFAGSGMVNGAGRDVLKGRVSADGNMLHLTGCDGSEVCVCSVDGRVCYRGNPAGDVSLPLAAGVYVVADGYDSVKVIM